MKLIIRNFLFVLRRFTTSSILNVLGLGIAFAVFFVIIVQTYYDFGFNRNFKKADNIYLYTFHDPQKGDRRLTTSTRASQQLSDIFPEVKNYCFMQDNVWYYYDIHDSADNIAAIYNEATTFTNEGKHFIEMFTPEIIAGDPTQAFSPGKALLTESTAKRFFGDEDPAGKVFYIRTSNIPLTVAAVCKDFPENCSLRNGVYLSRGHDRDNEWSYASYVELIPGGKDKIIKIQNEKISQQEEESGSKWMTELTPLPDIHLKFPAKGKGSLSTTISLLAIGILLILVAYINFLNFAAAMAPIRLKSFNIRRILGENSAVMKLSVIMEAVFLSFIAFLLSILFIHYFNGGVIKEFFLADLSLAKNTGLLVSFGVTSLLMGFIAGVYPAFHSTSFKPAIAINASFSSSSGSKKLRAVLIVVQFVTVLFLIIVSGFIKIQHDYLQSKSWGIGKENVLYIYTGSLGQNVKNFEDELRKNPDIYNIAYSSNIPGYVYMTWGRPFENKQIYVTVWPVSSEFLRFFGVDILEGRDFQEGDDEGSEKMIFNQTFVKKYEFDDIVGKQLPGLNLSGETNDMADIVGIAEDINFESLREPVKPMAFITGKQYESWTKQMFIRINGQNTAKALDYIRGTWKNFTSEPISVDFLEETHHQLYKQESDLAKLISIFGLLTIVVAIMGVYGLILFNAKSKRKLIAIHKVNGASKLDVILLLNHGFLIQFAVAYLIAVPLAYFVVHRWLENFAYQTPIHWWVFVAGGLLVFLITVITVSWQSYKAASVNPIDAIKAD
jgi:putative ABC transport system permease protein